MFSNITCEDAHTTKVIVKNSNTLAWVIEQVVADELEYGTLVEVPVCDMVSQSESPAVILIKNRTLQPAAEEFLKLLF